jgi:hypothetical protein
MKIITSPKIRQSMLILDEIMSKLQSPPSGGRG